MNSAPNAPVGPFNAKQGEMPVRPTSGQTVRPTSGQTVRPTSGQTARPTSGQTARPTARAGSPEPAGQGTSAPPEESLQGPGLALARILGRIVTALDLLTGDDGRRALSTPPGSEPAGEALNAIREELRLAREELTPLQGTGDALLSSAGRDAKAQQRTDPSHAPHFGG